MPCLVAVTTTPPLRVTPNTPPKHLVYSTPVLFLSSRVLLNPRLPFPRSLPNCLCASLPRSRSRRLIFLLFTPPPSSQPQHHGCGAELVLLARVPLVWLCVGGVQPWVFEGFACPITAFPSVCGGAGPRSCEFGARFCLSSPASRGVRQCGGTSVRSRRCVSSPRSLLLAGRCPFLRICGIYRDLSLS